MARRAGYIYGNELPKGPRGQISAGLCATVFSGTITIVPPNLNVTHTVQTEVIDGVELIFQVTPGTEAPAEMNFFLISGRCAWPRTPLNVSTIFRLFEG
jgi:alkyl sulfatase BDS1-like metallo-beta-lactamase superfamily hydrolase